MNEDDYIALQTLLAKFRIVAMKEMGASNTSTKIREKDLKIIRHIDYLRNNTIIKLYQNGKEGENGSGNQRV